jgi:mannose-6-phosphate isomerase-like protein (cupin superfamily)
MLVNNREKASVIRTPHNSEIRPLMDRTNSAIAQCSLAEEILPVGSSVTKHFHKSTEEIYYVLEGSGRMTVGSEIANVAPGDAIFIPKECEHTLSNTGVSPLKILLVCGPAHDFSDHFPS